MSRKALSVIAVVLTILLLLAVAIPNFLPARAAAIVLLPLVLKGIVPGNEIERPMAIVILGGLVTSTLLNLFLLPAWYSRFGERANSNPRKPVTGNV